MELSNELKVERIRLSLTAKSVAEEMGISRQQLCNIEQSETAPVVVKYIAFLRSKGVDLNALFDRIIVIKYKISYEKISYCLVRFVLFVVLRRRTETCQPGFFRDAEKYRRQYGRSGEAH